ncbi:MAG: hypothetical protein FWF28_07740, partial [Micrococcales bacterium]|nr:hypothetical protein [Micrococcales bacterium]
HPDIALLGALLMLAVGFAGYAFTRWMIFVPGWIQGLCWLAAVAAIVALVIYMLQHRRPTNPQPAGTPFAGSPYATPAAPYRGPAADAPFGAPFAAPPAGPAPAAGFAAAMSGSMGTPGSPMPVPPPIWTGPAAASGPAPSHYATAPMPTPIVVTAPPAVVGAPKQPKPPKPPKPRYPRAGAATFGIVVGLSLLVIVGSLIAQRTGWLHAYAAAGTAAALIVVIFGIALIVTGLRGRRGGGIGFLALIAMIVALPLAVTTHNGTNPWIVDANGVHVQTTQGTVTVTDRTTAAQGLQMGFGSATLDLTGVPLETNNQLTVPINLSAGNLVVVVPAGSQVAAQVDVGAGQLSWQVGGENTSVSGLGRQTDLGVPAGQADLMLQITVGAGQVTVQEGTR